MRSIITNFKLGVAGTTVIVCTAGKFGSFAVKYLTVPHTGESSNG
jgi:hypothetical protein